MQRFLITLIVSCAFAFANAQSDSLMNSVQLDEFVVQAQGEGFDTHSFVKSVMEDTTFYKAFLNMKTFPHTVRSELKVRNKKEKETASLVKNGTLSNEGNGMVKFLIKEERVKGKLKNKKGEHRYLTAEMYEEVFWPTGTYPANNLIKNREQELVKGSKIDEYKSELKKFMFNPGQEIGTVPFIGNKMALFDEHMIQYYDYRIWSDKRSGRECWVFSADAKSEFKTNKTVIKSMDTWFDKNSWQVRARHYHLKHSSIILDFDINIQVENVSIKGNTVPTRINYDGQFDLPFQKPEIVKFWLMLSDWTVPEPED